jgi:hypothetical protein
MIFMNQIKISNFLFWLLCILFATGCDGPPNFPAGNVTGYKPVYATPIVGELSLTSPRPIVTPGKIVRYANYLLINDKKQGIHFFDNTDPSSPLALGFLAIEGNIDLALEDGVLCADDASSLIAMNINDLHHIKILSRTTVWSLIVPPTAGYYFECPDTTKGAVIDWYKTDLNDPKCYRSVEESYL